LRLTTSGKLLRWRDRLRDLDRDLAGANSGEEKVYCTALQVFEGTGGFSSGLSMQRGPSSQTI
jgi:hypothetical protein